MTMPLLSRSVLARGSWALLAVASGAHGAALARAAALSEWAGAAAGAAAGPLLVLAASYLVWLPLSWAGGPRLRGVARASALASGACLALVFPFIGLLGAVPAAATAAASGGACAAGLLFLAAGRRALLGLGVGALLAGGGFLIPRALWSLFGPVWGSAALLPVLAAATALLAFSAGRGRPLGRRLFEAAPAAGLVVCAGAFWNGFAVPVLAYRAWGVSPRAIVGVDGQGGCFVRNRTGDVFHARSDGGWERSPLPAGLRLGRVAAAGRTVLALEIRPEGDRLWRAEEGTATAAPVGSEPGEPVFVADYAMDGGVPVAVDALGARLVWVGAGGGLVRAEYPPAEAGAPLLVAADGGVVHVFTEAGNLLSLSERGTWSVLRLPPPPGRPAALGAEAGRFVLLVRGDAGKASLWSLSGGVAGRWKPLGAAGRWPRLATDGRRVFALEGGAVKTSRLSGEEGAVLGPPAARRRAFERTPGGALIRLVE